MPSFSKHYLKLVLGSQWYEMYKKEDKIWFGLQGVTLDGSIWTFWISKKKTDKSGRRTRTTCTTCSIFSSSDNIYILNLFKHVLTYSYVKHFLISSWIFLHMSLYVIDHCSVKLTKTFHFEEQFELRENFLWINTYILWIEIVLLTDTHSNRHTLSLINCNLLFLLLSPSNYSFSTQSFYKWGLIGLKTRFNDVLQIVMFPNDPFLGVSRMLLRVCIILWVG